MSQDSSQSFRVERIEGVTVISPLGGQIDVESKDDLYSLAEQLADTPPPRRVVLNMAGVRTLNSAAIGVLVNFQKRVRDAVGALKLCCLDPYVLDLFRLTRMDQVLEVRGSQQEAIDAFLGKAASAPSGDKGSWFSRVFGK